MNEIVARHKHTRTTQAAEGVPRWRWTTAELERLDQLGAFHPEDKFELIGGEIVPMSPRNRFHEVVADQLTRYWMKRSPVGVFVGGERQFNLDADAYTYPDVIVMPDSIKAYDLRGPDALLVVEVADSSLEYDHHAKAAIYARYAIREYWVINARTHATTIHREPGAAGYGSTSDPLAPTETLVPLLVPALAVRLADLDLA